MARSQTLWRRPPARSPLDREIARLAVPAFGALIAEPLYVLTDTAVVGHLGTPQLAGLAVASSVLLTLYAVFIFLAYGTTAAVSRLLGAGDEREAAHQAVQSMWLALLIGLGVIVIGLGLSGPVRLRPLDRPRRPPLTKGGRPRRPQVYIPGIADRGVTMTTLLMIGTRKGLFLARSDDRLSWSLDGPHFAMNSVYAAAIDPRPAASGGSARLLAGADSEHWGPSVFRSDDFGASWQETEGGAIRFPTDTGEALVRTWQLRPAGADQPGLVWAGVEPGALFRSDDGGETFSLVQSLWNHPHRERWTPGGGGLCLHTVVPHATDPDRMLVGVSAAGVYRTDDGGESWEASNTGIDAWRAPDQHPEFGQCVHKFDGQRDRPDRLFLQNHGGVYRSDDFGATWSAIGENLPADFGFPVAAHPHRAGTAYVYPLVKDEHRMPPEDRCRIYRTTDAGESWQPLADGLPQQRVYVSVLRDALCTDDADPAGVYFGTRSGEVFASADEGTSWTSIVRHLPDVLVVRAAELQ